MPKSKSTREIAVSRLVLVPIRPGLTRRFPAGWTGRVAPEIGDFILAEKAGEVAADKKAKKSDGDD